MCSIRSEVKSSVENPVSQAQQTDGQQPFLFFRPLLAGDQRWAALESVVVDPSPGAAGEVARALAAAGSAALSKRMPIVLWTAPEWLADSEFIARTAADQAILVLPASVLDEPQILATCQHLARQGRHLALQIEAGETIARIPEKTFDHLQIEAAYACYELSALDLVHLGRTGLCKIAGGVDSHVLFDWLQRKHFDLCDGSFVGTIDPRTDSGPNMARLKVLKLLSLVIQDADTREIEEIFRQDAQLSYSLLRLVNSVAVGAQTRVSSFRQAIALLGRRQLQRWLQLLIYADQLSTDHKANPLLQLAAERGRQLELLSSPPGSADDGQEVGDLAFMTGIFSLLDVLLRLPMAEILAELPLPLEVAEALANGSGRLGSLLKAIASGETMDIAAARDRLVSLGIDAADHSRAQIGAFLWAMKINEAA